MNNLIELSYGEEKLPFVFDPERFTVLAKENEGETALSDAQINQALDAPVDSDLIETVVEAGETVLIVVPDATRQSASGQIVNLLVRRLIANGVMPFDIRIIFATGIHRPTTPNEKIDLLTQFIVQRVKTLDHNGRDLVRLINLGTTKRGTTIELNRALIEHDKVILVGGVSFHYFAGFGGGRKLICPGLASSRTVNETHKITFDFEKKRRRDGVEIGKLAGNPVHEEFVEIVEKINPAFAINTIVNAQGNAAQIFAGNWRASHEKACQYYLQTNSIAITEQRPLVIVSTGGAPFDLNLIQAHKALEMASYACTPGGTIIWLAECADGLGRSDFLNWFEAENADKLAEKLQTKFQVNGQTAWSLLEKAERFKIHLISNLPEDQARRMRLNPVRNLNEALTQIAENTKGYILPFGAKYLPQTGNIRKKSPTI